MAADTYQIVTDRITEALAAGTVPWHKPWSSRGGMPRNLVSKKEYRGINLLLLALGTPYVSPYWVTYKQAQELGGNVKKGEKSSVVTFWKMQTSITKTDEETGDKQKYSLERSIPLLRYYHVFNAEQCDGLKVPVIGDPDQEHTPIEACEAVVAGMPHRPEIKRNDAQAFYVPALDYVGMPDLCRFSKPEEYYSVLFHELTHATGHERRLNRNLSGISPFGAPDYSKEELVAEFGASFLCGHTGIFPQVADNNAAYIAGWLSKLRGDKKLLPVAAAQAQKATDYILGVEHNHESE